MNAERERVLAQYFDKSLYVLYPLGAILSIIPIILCLIFIELNTTIGIALTAISTLIALTGILFFSYKMYEKIYFNSDLFLKNKRAPFIKDKQY